MHIEIMKDSSIHRLLKALDRELGVDGYRIEDDWEGDLCAIGVADPRDLSLVVYISTYELPVGRFYFECEVRASRGSAEYEVISKGNEVTFDDLLLAIKDHFKSDASRCRPVKSDA